MIYLGTVISSWVNCYTNHSWEVMRPWNSRMSSKAVWHWRTSANETAGVPVRLREASGLLQSCYGSPVMEGSMPCLTCSPPKSLDLSISDLNQWPSLWYMGSSHQRGWFKESSRWTLQSFLSIASSSAFSMGEDSLAHWWLPMPVGCVHRSQMGVWGAVKYLLPITHSQDS